MFAFLKTDVGFPRAMCPVWVNYKTAPKCLRIWQQQVVEPHDNAVWFLFEVLEVIVPCVWSVGS